MSRELGQGVVFVKDYGYDRIRTSAEFDRVYSLHRRYLRKRYLSHLMRFASLCCVIAGIIILVFWVQW